jgi:hypothetical protein
MGSSTKLPSGSPWGAATPNVPQQAVGTKASRVPRWAEEAKRIRQGFKAEMEAKRIRQGFKAEMEAKRIRQGNKTKNPGKQRKMGKMGPQMGKAY